MSRVARAKSAIYDRPVVRGPRAVCRGVCRSPEAVRAETQERDGRRSAAAAARDALPPTRVSRQRVGDILSDVVVHRVRAGRQRQVRAAAVGRRRSAETDAEAKAEAEAEVGGRAEPLLQLQQLVGRRMRRELMQSFLRVELRLRLKTSTRAARHTAGETIRPPDGAAT